MRVLGIDVPETLVTRWVGWLMPDRQPFVVPSAVARDRGWSDSRPQISAEVADSFELYGIPARSDIVLLNRKEWRTLPPEIRRAQPSRHRWPSGDRAQDIERAVRFVEEGRRASRHADVSESTWLAASGLDPRARSFAGTFPAGSGPNCFAMVMATAGVGGAEAEWIQLDQFEEWLASTTEPGGRDGGVGTVLVWRTSQGDPAHAAVTLGDGWLLHKPSQGWMSPTKVLHVRDGKFSARRPGLRLHRYRLV